jgi:diguanylate cyclase (GGDEF)-like protein
VFGGLSGLRSERGRDGGFEVRLRLMALLFLTVGAAMAFVMATTPLRFASEHAGTDPLALEVLAGALVVLGLCTLVVPWHRFGRNAFFVVPAAATVLMALIIRYSGVWGSFGYEMLVLVCVFYGLYFDRRTSAVGVLGVVFAGMSPQLFAPDAAELVEYLLVYVPVYLTITFVSGYMTRQVSLREGQKARLRREVSLDGLTGLANRRGLEEQLVEELNRMRRYGSPLTVLFLDLDNFKQVNDQRGHHTGDEVLRLVADTLRSDVRLVDTAARYGGEEFVILLPGTHTAGAKALFGRMQKRLTSASVERLGFPVTMSAGAVEAGPDSEAGDLISAADEAMYEAKHRGKNQLAY